MTTRELNNELVFLKAFEFHKKFSFAFVLGDNLLVCLLAPVNDKENIFLG